MNDILLIELFPRETECIVCETPLVNSRRGIPMYEGEVLPNDWDGPWAGFDACPECYEAQGKLTEPVHSSLLRKLP